MAPTRHHLYLCALLVAALLVGFAAPARAQVFEFTTKELKPGTVDPEVKALEIRIAGWYPRDDQTQFVIDETYDRQTRWAVAKFQKHYGLAVDGIAGTEVFEVLAKLEDKDRSTEHFDYSEFWQNKSSSCSRKANRYAGTFQGGKVPAWRVKANVRRLMWRLESLRAKAGDNPIGINSGFRSVAYNDCIGGASLSQHMYGTAADLRVADVDNRTTRDLARAGQIHGIGCYSSLSHNHFDLRLQNPAVPEASFWWWPRQDATGRDLADDHLPCWGEKAPKDVGARMVPAHMSAAAIEAWEAAGEVHFDGAGD
ncbi:MAG: M15 family metallopeptidase [Actinomycetota bacterium]